MVISLCLAALSSVLILADVVANLLLLLLLFSVYVVVLVNWCSRNSAFVGQALDHCIYGNLI